MMKALLRAGMTGRYAGRVAQVIRQDSEYTLRERYILQKVGDIIVSKITRSVSRARDFFRSRTGAMLLLILSCFVCVSVFSPYIESVTVTADGNTQTFVTLRNNPKEIIVQAGLALDGEDQYRVINADDDTTEIEIYRAFSVNITDAGVTTTIEIASGTVADALAKAGVAQPDPNDMISDSLDTPLYAYMNIVIDRVQCKTVTTRETIEYKTIKHESKELAKGKTRVATKGVPGEKEIVAEYTWLNGELISTEIVKETVIKAAVDEVIHVGIAEQTTSTAPAVQAGGTLSTKPNASSNNATSGQFVDASGRAVSYSKVLTGSATAYTAEPGAKTATGRPVEVGLVAVDPKVIPYGTRLYIVSADGKHTYGYALAADTGSALKSGKALVDLFYETESQCLAFGRRDVIVYVLA